MCHTSCLVDRDTYTCEDTQQLRSANNINEGVIYLNDHFSVKAHTVTADTDNDNAGNAKDERQLEKEDLVSSVIQLQKQMTKITV